MDASELQDMINRLESLKRRQADLIEEQIELTKKVAEAVTQNDQARDFQAGQRKQTARDRDGDRQARRDGG
jgi:hypothetical protein